jgi:hypothetical protein
VGGEVRRTPLRRTAQRDPVTPEVRDAVLRRDGICVLALYEREHICRNRWGREHAPTEVSELTVEHVHDFLMMGKRAPSDPEHLVALDFAANFRPPTKAQRALFREYLAALYPAGVA